MDKKRDRAQGQSAKPGVALLVLGVVLVGGVFAVLLMAGGVAVVWLALRPREPRMERDLALAAPQVRADAGEKLQPARVEPVEVPIEKPDPKPVEVPLKELDPPKLPPMKNPPPEVPTTPKPPPPKERPTEFSAEVKAAWRSAGFSSGRMRRASKVNVFMFIQDWMPKNSPDELPAFYVFHWKPGALAKLPAPECDFGFDVTGLDTPEEFLKEAARFERLHTLHLGCEIKAYGLKEIGRMRELRVLSFYSNDATDAELKDLAGLKHLHHLDLGANKATEAGIKELAPLTQLRFLTFKSAKLTDAGFKDLAQLRELEGLAVNSRDSGEGLKHLAGLKLKKLAISCSRNATGLDELAFCTELESLQIGGHPGNAVLKGVVPLKKLRSLDIWGTRISDAKIRDLAALPQLQTLRMPSQTTNDGLVDLPSFPQLQNLYLDNTQVTSHGMRILTDLKQLQYLSLVQVNITDAGMKEIGKMTKLRTLNMLQTKTSDAGLKELANLKELRTLLISGNITKAGQDRLRQALPDLKINPNEIMEQP